MNLTETHIINMSNELDILTSKCKNFYNRVNYVIRQEFINNGRYINKLDMFTRLKDDFDYKELPSIKEKIEELKNNKMIPEKLKNIANKIARAARSGCQCSCPGWWQIASRPAAPRFKSRCR